MSYKENIIDKVNKAEPEECNRCTFGKCLPGQAICEYCKGIVEQEEKEAKEVQLYEDVEMLKKEIKDLREVVVDIGSKIYRLTGEL